MPRVKPRAELGIRRGMQIATTFLVFLILTSLGISGLVLMDWAVTIWRARPRRARALSGSLHRQGRDCLDCSPA